MNEWTLLQYKHAFSDFYADCEIDLREAVDECLNYFVKHGNMTGLPYSKPLGNGIFELRASTNKEEARFLYFFHPTERKIAVIATAFKKKTRKTPSGEIEAAKRVKKLVTANPEIPNEIPVYN